MEIWKNINWKKLMKRLIIGVITLSIAFAQTPEYLNNKIDQMADQLERQVIEWRRDFHENPELSNREFRTAEKVANHLRSLGIDVQTGVAHTGVVGLLKRSYLYPYFLLRILTNAVPSWKNSVQVKFYLVSRSCRT